MSVEWEAPNENSLSLSCFSFIHYYYYLLFYHFPTIFQEIMGCFFFGDWFKTIISQNKLKEDKSKHAKVDLTIKKSNSSKSRYLTGKVSNSPTNGASSRNAGVLSMPIEDIAATKIQTAFWAYMARKALRHMKGTKKFQAFIESHNAINQASSALSQIHSWSRIQTEIRARRLCMVTEGRIRQKKLENQLKLEAKLHELEVEWCGGSETMEEILCRIQQREEAAVKRERAMAYAFSHQWRANSSPHFGQAYYDLGKENWGWSWMERWIAVRPWETRVHASPTTPKKAHTSQGSKVGKIKNQPAMRNLVSIRPISSNGKGTTKARPISSNGKGTTKARKLSNPSADKLALQEANTEGLGLV
ncbi:hypothetical protein F0562_010596 [Nyssa sinensis]|uniref:Protein IQ-DOMAIN 1 n=1 Tax=Nyssa sinensis TaxID=561372 RepID=A0A5J4ZYS4_9ASTE|nr:hypothetical protein F0562_010596 [Nyssa sinensis]